jgi:hypothetical protein
MKTGISAALFALSLTAPLSLHAGGGNNQGDDAVAISFSASNCFNADFSAYPEVTFFGPEDLTLDPFGPAVVQWEITVLATETGFEFIDGYFEWTFADKHKNKKHDNKHQSTLYGEYTGFALDPITGDYTLSWDFTGGTGKMDDYTGFGLTQGNADLSTLCAAYTFAGTLYED